MFGIKREWEEGTGKAGGDEASIAKKPSREDRAKPPSKPMDRRRFGVLEGEAAPDQDGEKMLGPGAVERKGPEVLPGVPETAGDGPQEPDDRGVGFAGSEEGADGEPTGVVDEQDDAHGCLLPV